MRQFQLNFREYYESRVTPWKRYDRLTDIPVDELKKIIKEENIKLIILDMDGTLKHYKKGLTNENKEWVSKIRNDVNLYIISNANKELTSKVADELKLKYIYKARKPSARGFKKILDDVKCNLDEIIMIGDAVRADIIGAQRFGINKTILLNDLNVIGLKKE